MKYDEEYVAEEEGRSVRYCVFCESIPVDWKIAKHGIMLCYNCAKDIAEAYHYEWYSPGEWLFSKVGEQKEKEKSYQKARISRSIRKQVFERDAYRCKHCGTWKDLTVDHIIPESKGGTLDLDNLQTLCRSCNSKKGTR